MFRSWIHRVHVLAVAGLAALPSAALGQTVANPPTDVLVGLPATAPASPDVLFFRALPAAPQQELELAFTAQSPAGQGGFVFAADAAPSAAAGQKADAGPFLFIQGAAPPVEVRSRVVDEAAAPAGEYWIGVQLEPLPEILVSQLKLERGMVVVQVFDDSPAAKAEVKVHDILLRAAGKDVKEPQDLIAAVNDAKENEIEIVALRGGTETTLKVKPAKRQADRQELRFAPETPHAEVVRALDDLYKRTPDGDVRLLAVRPGGVYAYAQAARFPDNLEVSIEKRGDQPAKIRVTRIQEGEDQTWEVTEDKLNDLPEDIRGHVQSMLGAHPPAAGGQLRLKLEAAQGHARNQAARAVARATEAQQQTLREYRVRVQPMTPGAAPGAQPPVPMTVKLPHAVGADPNANIQAKLDAILRKLDHNQGGAIERLDKEVQKLRKELNDLRQEKK
jgi:hypothetical protein